MFTQIDYSNCDHKYKYRSGFNQWTTKKGIQRKQRWRCTRCNKWFTEDVVDNQYQRIAKLAPLFLQGISGAKAAKIVGYERKSVHKMFRFLKQYQEKMKNAEREVRTEALHEEYEVRADTEN